MMEINKENIWSLKEEALNQNISIRIILTGTSMLPFLRSGDEAIVNKVNSIEIKSGDIIAFKVREQFVVHRMIKKIINKENLSFITKGDSCKEFDKHVSESDLIGKVTIIKRNNTTFNLNIFRIRCISKLYACFPKLSYYNYLMYFFFKKTFIHS